LHMSRQRSVFMFWQRDAGQAAWWVTGCGEQAGERGDGFEQQGVDAGLLVGGPAGAEVGDCAAVLGLGGELADPGGDGRVHASAAARCGAVSRG